MSPSPLELTRAQILAFRRRVGALDQRLPPGRRSLRQAAWAGLTDSVPRAALLSINARVEGTGSRPRDLHVGQAPRRRAPPAEGRGHGRQRACTSGGTAAERQRRAKGTRGRQRDQVRRNDRHRADSLGRRAVTDDLDGATAGDGSARRARRARPPVPARLRPGHAASIRHLGRRPGEGGPRDVRRAQRVAHRGANADRRSLDSLPRRAGLPRTAGPSLPPPASAAPRRRRRRGRPRAERDGVETEAQSLPLPGIEREIAVRWEG